MSNRFRLRGRTLSAIIPFLKDAVFDQADIIAMSRFLMTYARPWRSTRTCGPDKRLQPALSSLLVGESTTRSSFEIEY